MKKIVLYGAALGASLMLLAGCNCFKKMAQNYDQINVVANPEMLTLVGGNIVTDVTVTIPSGYYNPKAIAKVTPILRFEGDSLVGTPKYLQGEKVKDNYPVIAKKGGSYTQSIFFPWNEKAAVSKLEFKLEGKCKDSEEFVVGGYIPVAEGVNTLQNDLAYDESMTLMPDNFQRITHESAFVDLMYKKNSSTVNASELSKEQVKQFEEFVKNNEGKDRITLENIQAKGYASPEGPESFNTELSKKRSDSGKNAVSKKLKKSKAGYDVASYGQDWEGFTKIVQASDMKDKNLVLQVLNMYSSSAQRDSEIRNMAAVFEELQKGILPQLRRTQIVATTDIQGKTDEELTAAVKHDIASLDLEELLFAATLFEDNNVKIEIYKAAADRFNDARAWNNLGMAYAANGDWANAEAATDRAATLSTDPAIANNLAIIALATNNTAKAAQYLPAAGNSAKGLAAVSEGKYAQAATELEGYNKAVAEVLNGNLNAAKNALTGDENANAYYLRGVIAVKEGNNDAALTAVRTAVEKDATMLPKAKKDINLAPIAGQL